MSISTPQASPDQSAGSSDTSRRLLYVAAPAVISIVTLLALTALIEWGSGHPERFNSVGAYRAFMDVAVLARFGPAFLSAIIVYPAMRLRGASIGWAGWGAASSAIAFGLVSAVLALRFFPPAQALYYALNPMVVAALGSQVAFSALAEVFVRWRRHGRAGLRNPRLWAIVIAVATAGFALCYVGVIWDGGRHWFYVWIRGFMLFFGNGQ